MSSLSEYFYKSVAKNIKRLRLERGLTQEKLAELIGVNDKYFGHVERCEKAVSHKVVIKLIELWHLQISDIYSVDEEYCWQE